MGGYRAIRVIAFPLITAGINEAVIELTDTAFLARFGLIELAAVAIGATLYEIAGCLQIGIADGIQILVARRAGQAHPASVGAVFRSGFAGLVGLSILLMAGLGLFGPGLLERFVASAGIAAAAGAYVQIVAIALVFHGLNLAWAALYTGLGRTRVLVYATGLLALTNIGLDYCLIFGKLGFPELGIRGAALASLAAEAATFVFFTAFAAAKGHIRHYRLFAVPGRGNGSVGPLAAISWPVALEGLVVSGRWLAFFLIVERAGEEMLAWASIAHAVYALLFIPLDGFSEATCTLVSRLVGQAREDGIALLLRRAATMTAGLIAPLALLLLVAPELVLAIFTTDPETVAGCAPSLRVIALLIAAAIPGELLFSAVAGTGNTRGVLLVQLAVTLPALAYAYLAALTWGLELELVWLAEAIVWLTALAGGWMLLSDYSRQRNS